MGEHLLQRLPQSSVGGTAKEALGGSIEEQHRVRFIYADDRIFKTIDKPGSQRIKSMHRSIRKGVSLRLRMCLIVPSHLLLCHSSPYHCQR